MAFFDGESKTREGHPRPETGNSAGCGLCQINERSQTGVSFPMWIYYLALPVGSGLMSIRYINVLYRLGFNYVNYSRELASESGAPAS